VYVKPVGLAFTVTALVIESEHPPGTTATKVTLKVLETPPML
jgi:hypothetical protein